MDAHAWDERYAGSELIWSVEPNQFVARECAGLPPGRAVDLACGEGRNALWLAEQGWEVTALDFSAVALQKGRALAAGEAHAGHRDRVTWQQADATTWSGSDYDLALLAYLQLTADGRRAAVRGAYDALRPGGTFLLVAHDSTNLTEGTGGPQDPTVLMSAADVLGDLGLAPYDPAVVHAGRVSRRVASNGPAEQTEHRAEPGRTAWDCLVRVTRG